MRYYKCPGCHGVYTEYDLIYSDGYCPNRENPEFNCDNEDKLKETSVVWWSIEEGWHENTLGDVVQVLPFYNDTGHGWYAWPFEIETKDAFGPFETMKEAKFAIEEWYKNKKNLKGKKS